MNEEKLWRSELCESAVMGYRRIPLKFHTVDRSLLRVTNKAVENGKKIVINYPLHRCDLLVPITLEACYANLNAADRGKVLLITNKLDVRDFYENLTQAGGKVSAVLFPIGMVSRKGDIKPIYESIRGLHKKYKDFIRDSVVLVSSSLKCLPNDASEIGSVIFDLSSNYETEAIDYLLRWANENSIKSVVFIISESQSKNISHFNTLGLPIWGWTPAMLKKEFEMEELKDESFEAPFYQSAIQVKRLADGISRKVVVVDPPPRFKEMLLSCYKYYNECWKVFKVKQLPLLREALFTYSRSLKIIERMTAPLDCVEEEEEVSWGVLSLKKRVDKLKALQEKISKDEPIVSSLLTNAIANIERLRDWILDNSNPKYEKLIALLQENKGKKICIVSFRACDKNATVECLAKKLNVDEEGLKNLGVYFATHSDLDALAEPFDLIFIVGAVPNYAKFLLRETRAEELNFLVYPTETVLIEKQIIADNEIWNSEFSVEERALAMSKLLDAEPSSLKPHLTKIYKDAKPPRNQKLVAESLRDQGKEDKIQEEPVNELFSQLPQEKVFEGEFNEDLSEDDDDSSIDFASDDVEFSDEGIEIDATFMDFGDGEAIAVPDSKRLPVFLEFKEKIIYKEARKISKGDMVVIINKGTKDTLAQSMFQVLHKLPSMKDTVLYAQAWVLMLRRDAVRAEDDSWTVLEKLQDEGTKITDPLTITHWVLGETIGPRDKEDILRIAKAYNNKFLKENYETISAAVSSLRGIHHTLVRKLSLLIPTAGLKAMRGESHSEGLISPELGLHVEDFYDAMTLKKVSSIKKVKGDYNMMNKLVDLSELEELEDR